MSRTDGAFARMEGRGVTGSLRPSPARAPAPTETDLALARNAASDVLTKGDKDSSQSWENPETGARGSVTPLAAAYACGWTDLPGLPGKLCQRRVRELAAGRGLSIRQGPMGNPQL